MPDPGGKEIHYWDAMVFSSFITEQDPDRVAAFTRLLANLTIRTAHYRLVLSTFIITEVRPPPDTRNPHHETSVRGLFHADRPYIRFYAVTMRIAERARDLAVQYPTLTNPDAIHLATALEAGADVFYTYDGPKDNKRRRSGNLLYLNERIGSPPL